MVEEEDVIQMAKQMEADATGKTVDTIEPMSWCDWLGPARRLLNGGEHHPLFGVYALGDITEPVENG